MSRIICFFKRKKKFGGYRDDGKNKSLGYLGCGISMDYFVDTHILDADLGDTVMYKGCETGLPIDTVEVLEKYFMDRAARLIKFFDLDDELEKCRTDEEFWDLYGIALKKKFMNPFSFTRDKDDPYKDDIRYLMTDERKQNLFEHFQGWSEGKTKEDIELMTEQLGELEAIIDKVDFDKENLYFAYSY